MTQSTLSLTSKCIYGVSVLMGIGHGYAAAQHFPLSGLETGILVASPSIAEGVHRMKVALESKVDESAGDTLFVQGTSSIMSGATGAFEAAIFNGGGYALGYSLGYLTQYVMK